MKAVGAFSVKSYNQPRRDARQQIIEAARERRAGGARGGQNYATQHDDGARRSYSVGTTFRRSDVRRCAHPVSRARRYTPTLVVNYGGLSGEYWWYQHDEVWKNERLRRFTPDAVLDSRARRRQMAADDDYQYQDVSRAANAFVGKGGKVQVGAHGQLHGQGAHWEMWMLGQGEMSNHNVLRAATSGGLSFSDSI